MKKFFKEFGEFIKRGNVMDLAVGVIIGGAFSAIVTALTNQILMPLVNWVIAVITNGEGMEGAVTFLQKVVLEDGTVDLANSIFIDWGAFITAILNFIIIAFVLFLIIKTINHLNDKRDDLYCGYTKKEYFKMLKEGKKHNDIEALAKERDEKKKAEEDAKKAEEEALKNAPTKTEVLLSDILEELKKNK